jgi:hypothetical protein
MCQTMIWDYASLKPEFLKETKIEKETIYQFRVFCSLDMVNALLATRLSFTNPSVAFIHLFTKLPMIVIARFFVFRNRKKNN